MAYSRQTSVRNKQRLLQILDYLYHESDEEHQVSTKELVERFTAEDAHATRKTVKDDIDVLQEEGYDIITRKGFWNYFWMASREFELPELKMLIDAVSASRFITRRRRRSSSGSSPAWQAAGRRRSWCVTSMWRRR